jgi:acyl-CoA thioester hydrolase
MNAEATDEKLNATYYKHWIEDRVRYRDLDTFGHLNSAVYSTYFETGRVEILRSAGLVMTGPLADPFALVRQAIDYRKELNLGTRVRIGTRIVKLGRTSVAMASAIFDGDDCAATAEIIGVRISRDTRRPLELTEELRQRFSIYL